MFGFGRKSDIESQISQAGSTEKEWRLIERVVMANTHELRKTRRWGIFFKLLTFIYLFGIFIYFIVASPGSYELGNTGGHTAVVAIEGTISEGEAASSGAIISSMRRALEHPDTKALVLRINSPGGSPVQASYVYNEINRLRELHSEIPIYAVIVDTGASGAYYIAAAADEIYANGSSIVGSIGVTAAGFGFEGLIDLIGVERRQFVSGEHKAFLDPFLPVDPKEQALFESTLNRVHEQFITDVQAGRGDRLADNPDLFSGLFWSGAEALELGLIDDLKSTGELARELGYPELIDFSYRPTPLEQFARNLGVSIAETLVSLGLETDFVLR